MSTLKVNNVKSITKYPPFILNSSGEEIGKLASAWVVFEGNGDIFNSSNIISITDTGNARYVLSFTPGLRINNPAVSGVTNASTNIVHCNIQNDGTTARDRQSIFSSMVRVFFNECNASTASGQTAGTYYAVSVIGDNAYGSPGNLRETT